MYQYHSFLTLRAMARMPTSTSRANSEANSDELLINSNFLHHQQHGEGAHQPFLEGFVGDRSCRHPIFECLE